MTFDWTDDPRHPRPDWAGLAWVAGAAVFWWIVLWGIA